MIIVRHGKAKTPRELARKMNCKRINCEMDCSKCIAPKSGTIVNFGGHCCKAHFNKDITTNKLEAYRRMEEEGIPQIELFDHHNDIPDCCYPIFGRKKYHSRGRDIVICNNIKDAENSGSDFFTKYVDKKSEYRVHVLGDMAFGVRAKVPDGEDYDPMVRNRGKGWKQVNYKGIYREQLKKLSIEAVKALGMDFGAVDIIRDQDNNLLVLEVNSAPSLNDWKQEVYISFFRGENYFEDIDTEEEWE